jgi:hypothetical protein
MIFRDSPSIATEAQTTMDVSRAVSEFVKSGRIIFGATSLRRRELSKLDLYLLRTQLYIRQI